MKPSLLREKLDVVVKLEPILSDWEYYLVLKVASTHDDARRYLVVFRNSSKLELHHLFDVVEVVVVVVVVEVVVVISKVVVGDSVGVAVVLGCKLMQT